MSDSIKVTRDISTNKLAKSILWDINSLFHKYTDLNGDIELLIMGRPWLSVDEFDFDKFIDRKSLLGHFDEVLEKKLSYWTESLREKDSSKKVLGLKDYPYKNIYMNNYGDPVYDKK